MRIIRHVTSRELKSPEWLTRTKRCQIFRASARRRIVVTCIVVPLMTVCPQSMPSNKWKKHELGDIPPSAETQMHRPSDEYAVTTNSAHEYAPTATDMPPPYTFAPSESDGPSLLNDNVALQLVNVLLEMA